MTLLLSGGRRKRRNVARLIATLAAVIFSPSICIATPLSTTASPTFPIIDGLMRYSDLRYADWLSNRYSGRRLLVPINFVIVDPISKTGQESRDYIVSLFSKAGYPKQIGHYRDYLASIDGVNFPQIPGEWKTAFSSAPFWKTNDVVRLFGPGRWQGAYFIAGSVMRESFALLSRVHHKYLSYNLALSTLTEKLTAIATLKTGSPITLDRQIDSIMDSLGDDDGRTNVFIRIR